MSAEAHYFRVGLFVFIGFTVIAAAAVVLGGRGLFTREVLMETYFDEAVTGLEIGSAVRLRGVRRGTVAQIGFDVVKGAVDPEVAVEGDVEVPSIFQVYPEDGGSATN